MFRTWLTAWLLGVSAVGVLIVGLSMASTYAALKRAGAPGPGRILRRLWLNPFACLIRSQEESTSRLVGAQAWVWWDVRWGPSGQTAAVVTGVDGAAVHLRFANPVELCTATDETTEALTASFLPAGQPRYDWAVPRGVLAASSEGLSTTTDSRTNARICVG